MNVGELKVELKVVDLPEVKALIDLMCEHYYQLPKEVQEHIAKHFGGDDE